MARPKDSRSPAPARSSDSSRRRRRGDDRRDRDRRDDGRDFRRPSRSLSPERRPRDRGSNYRDCDRERERDRERARARDKERDRDLIRRMEATDARDETFNRSVPRDYRVRDRRRTPDRYAARPRSPGRRRNRSPGSDRSHRSRDDSCDRPRAPREGRADTTRRSSQATPSGDGARPEPDECQKSRAGGSQPEADRKAERLAKLEAWKKKKETESQMQKARHPDERSQTMQLLAEMDRKANMQTFSSPMIDATSATPTTAAVHQPHMVASSTQPYTGKFDPKSIAKKSAAARSHDSAKSVLGSLHVQPSQQLPPTATDRATAASALPANRGKTSGFGFGKAQPVNDKLPNKRKLDLDEEVTVQRTLKKLPALSVDPELEPGHDQDEDYGSGDNIGEDEEAAVAADRAAHEKRLQAENQVDEQADEQAGNQTDEWASDQADNQTDGQAGEQTGEQTGEEDGTTDKNANFIPQETNVDAVQGGDKAPAERTAEQAVTEPMDVDVEEDVDPLDAFMDNLQQTEMRKPAKTTRGATTAKQPETYFSDEDNVFDVGADGDPGNILALANKRKKKDIPTTDYSKIKIEEVRKKFWVEPMELSSMTDTELADLRLELDGIKVKGKDIPKPVQKWAQCGLTGQALEVIGSLGYEKPTSIQMQAIPALMSGRDMVGVAKTGSGKTIAFLIPMFRHIMDQPPIRETDGPIGLIMTPTRELATQIHRDCKPFAKTMGLRAVCAYGGAPVRDQIADLKRGAAIIVCTPGRMIDLLAANQGRVTNLRRVTYVVLDEADRMFDMGFEPQVMKIFANMRPDKQTILFSATMPWLIDSLTKKILKNPIEITVGGRSVVAKEIQQVVEVRDDDTKFLRVLQLLGELYQQDEDARSLIFVDRQEKADDLLKELMVKGYPCMSIHGGKDQIDRDSTISDFKKGIFPVLIATSVAARGLDVKQLKLVINFDAPNHMEDYVHRSGRTGRAGNSGMAVTFVTPQQENCAVGIAKALEQSGQPVPEKLDEMRKAWREKVKSGKAKESSGFGGKGLDRLNDQREAARQVQRRTHRAEGEEEEEKEEKKDADKGEKALDAIKAVASAIHARDNPKVGGPDNKPGAGGTRSSKDPLDKVSSAVSAINSRLGKSGQLRSGQPIDNKGPDAGAFHATLEINDFPQKARWAVTNRTNVAKILESTGTSITTKGNFYPPGKEAPANGDPKLYILIEGETELAVKSAMQEMTRLLTDATNASVEAENRAPASGRYTVT